MPKVYNICQLLSRGRLPRDKLYIKWEEGLEKIVSNLKLILERDRQIYFGYEAYIEEIEINENLKINEIRYGEGSQVETVKESDLLILQNEAKLPREFVKTEGRKSYVIKSLFNEQEIKNLREDYRRHFPRKIMVKGQKSRIGTSVAVYICTDIFYFQDFDHNPLDQDFEVSCLLGRGGISDLVNRYGDFQKDNKFTLGNGLGALGAIVAVEFEGKNPICRSKYIIVSRAGIRYPDDIWRSKITNKPITSGNDSDISSARFIFQSRQHNGSSTDVFVADFNGERMFNLSLRNEAAYDGFFDQNGNEIARWIGNEIEYCSMSKGVRKIIKVWDPITENKG